MDGNILVVEEKGTAERVGPFLRRGGFRCYSARGPLAVRSVLHAHAIDLIIWVEASHNPGLAADLAGEWSRHPHVPVLHVYGSGLPSAAPSEATPFIAALPLASVEATLLPYLARHGSARDPAAAPAPARQTELAFRRVVARLRAGWPKAAPIRSGAPEHDQFDTAGTALDPAERSLLLSHRPAEYFGLPWHRRAGNTLLRGMARLRPRKS